MLPLQKRRAERVFAEMAKDIYLARRKRGWSQRELAERSRVGVATVQRIERADTRIKVETLFVVLGTLGLLSRLEMALSSYRYKEERDADYAAMRRTRRRETVVRDNSRRSDRCSPP